MEQHRLTNAHIVPLAREISCPNMESIALGYLNFDKDTIDSLKTAHRENTEAFNRDILHRWANQNPGNDQVQKLALILFQSAKDAGYANPSKVEEILGVCYPAASTHSQAIEKGKSEAYTKREFERLAAKIKTPTKQKMKIEVAPWIQDYVTTMDDLYTDLTLEKLDDRVIGGTARKLSNYKEVFDEIKGKRWKWLSCLKSEDNDDSEGERILFKGDPGMGKTTVSKKAAYDWAKGILKAFTIVFFVFLKLVKPGDSIENVIIEQTPVLESLRLKQSQLENILEMFGNGCLLILDGLDEHARGHNDDVIKIIKGQKLSQCHVLVTSRPHTTRPLESYFKNIVRVNGFSPREAEKFAFKILKRNKLVNQVLAYNPGNFMEKISLNNCPILLSFMCLLVRESQIDLSNDVINTGEVYTRMVRCLFKKFIIRRKMEYRAADFTQAITAVGKIAFRTLFTGNPLMRRSDVIKEVGPDAFDYRLLIGHEDAQRLIQDETADIFVTFPHRSLQEFLGVFYFIQALDKGESIKSLRENNAEPLFMTNPLCLYFCLWFVQYSEGYFTFENLENARSTIQEYVLSKINLSCLDCRNIATKFPAIDIENLAMKKDTVGLKAFTDILAKCQNVRTVKLENIDSLDWVLFHMRQVLPSINYITVREFCVMRRVHDHVLITEVRNNFDRTQAPNLSNKALRMAKAILIQYVDSLGGDLFIHIDLVFSYTNVSLQHLAAMHYTNIKGIHIEQSSTDEVADELNALPLFEHLQHLSFSWINFDRSEVMSLSQATQVGNLPSLTHLSFEECDLRDIFSLLFGSPWPRLTHLGFSKCDLDIEDYEMKGNMQDDRFLNLLSLSIGNENCSIPKKIFEFHRILVDTTRIMQHLNERLHTLLSFYYKASDFGGRETMELKSMSNLKNLHLARDSSDPLDTDTCLPPCPESLTLQNCVGNLQMLANNLFRNNLKHLDISSNTRVKGNLSLLMCDIFPSLVTLILQDCCLNLIDHSSLAQANVEGRLPKLKHLDISRNILNGIEYSLFAHSCKWNQLLSLNIMDTLFSEDELHRRVQSGCLSSLQELRISDYPQQPVDIVWPHLQILGTFEPSETLFTLVEEAVREGKFPTLRSICFEWDKGPSLHTFSAFQRLTEAKVLCHKIINMAAGLALSKCPCGSAFSFSPTDLSPLI